MKVYWTALVLMVTVTLVTGSSDGSQPTKEYSAHECKCLLCVGCTITQCTNVQLITLL